MKNECIQFVNFSASTVNAENLGLACILSRDSLPPATWRGINEELPEGTWRGVKEELPEGIWRGVNEELPEGTWRGVNEELPEGTWRANYVGNYECGDHSGDVYGFRFVEHGGGYEIDILSQPEYNGKEDSLSATRRISSLRGCTGIDLGNVVPATLTEAQKMAGSWAEQNQVYRFSGLRTGDHN